MEHKKAKSQVLLSNEISLPEGVTSEYATPLMRKIGAELWYTQRSNPSKMLCDLLVTQTYR